MKSAWPHQKRAVKAAFREWKTRRSTLYVCPTGGGKSRVFTEIARRFRPKGRTLILADRDSLVMQAQENILKHTSLTTGIEKAGQHVDAGNLPDVVCATIQSIRQPKRLKRFSRDAFALVVVDEADLAVTQSYVDVLARFPKAKVFGCTATPDRHDGQSLEDVFESVCATETIADLIEKGLLSRIRRRAIQIESVDLAKAPTHDGDFSERTLGRILARERPLHEVVKPTLEMSGKRPTIVFAATVGHAEALATVFNRYRRRSARAVHGGMSIKERARIMADFEAGKFQFLCNCVLLLRGVDVPFVSCISMARPTKSRALYCQALGRGTRLSPRTGKRNLLVIDFTDSSEMHSLIGVVDVVGAKMSPEVRERAREILSEQPDKDDVVSAIDAAIEQLKRDPEMCSRVKAVVEFRARQVLAVVWNEQPLGEMPDKVLAGLLGIHASTVCYERNRRGIGPFGRRKRNSDITVEDSLLGAMPDAELAAKLGCCLSAVAKIRKRRGIASYRSGRSGSEVDWKTAGLGNMTDTDLASRLGIGQSVVSRKRIELGIPKCVLSRTGINWSEQPLGQMYDVELASRLGVAAATVNFARRRLGIRSHRSGKRGAPL